MVETLNCTNINLKKGSKGADVTLLQKNLQSIGYYLKYNNSNLKVDGDFAKYTDWAVKQFQKANGLLQDGIVGPVTCKKLNEKLNAKAGISTTSTDSSSTPQKDAQTSNNAKKNTEVLIDTSKNYYPSSKANLHIEGLHFIMSDITYTKPYRTGGWKSISLMKGNYNYLTKTEPLEYSITCYLPDDTYKQMRSEIIKLETKVCTVTSKELTGGKYMVSVDVANQKKTHMKLTFKLVEYI